MVDAKYKKSRKLTVRPQDIRKTDDIVNKITTNKIAKAIKGYASKQESLDKIAAENEYIESFIIDYTDDQIDAIKSLNGQMGTRAKKFIQKGTIIARYVGKEMLQEEFDQLFDVNSLMFYQRNKYIFSTNFHDIKINKKSKRDREIEEKMKKYEQIIVEPDPNDRCLPSYINDCRRNIHNINKTEQDMERQNVDFVDAAVNGWPMVFVLSIKDIQAGEQLFGDYGIGYHTCISDYEYRVLLVKLIHLLKEFETIEEIKEIKRDESCDGLQSN